MKTTRKCVFFDVVVILSGESVVLIVVQVMWCFPKVQMVVVWVWVMVVVVGQIQSHVNS